MLRKWTKRLAVFLAVIVLLIAAVILFLHTPWGKSIVKNEVRKYLVNQLKTRVEIGNIDYRLPSWIQVENLLILDRGKDTLLYSENILVRMKMLKLLNSSIDINTIELDNIFINISRESLDSNFNYQFIIDAFASSANDTDTTSGMDTSSSSSPLNLKADQVSLNKIRFQFQDRKEKQYYSVQLGRFYCEPNQLMMDKNSFHVNEILSSDFNISMIDSSKTIINPSGPNENSPYEPPSLFVALGKLGIRNFQFAYQKPLDQFNLTVFLDTFQLDRSTIDMKEQAFNANIFLLHNSKISLNAWTKETRPAKEKELVKQSAEANQWNVRLNFLDLQNNSIAYHNNAVKPGEGFDYNHMEVERLNFASRANNLNANGFNIQIDSCSLVANKRFNLKGFSTSASSTDSVLLIRDLEIGFNQSSLITQGDLAWQLKPTKGSSREKFNCRIQSSSIAFADILLFQPSLKQSLPINLSEPDKITFSGNLRGSLNDFRVDRLKINSKQFVFEGNTKLDLNSKKENYVVKIDQLEVQKKILSTSFLDELTKQKISLPEYFSASGRVNGTFDKVIADLKLNSEYGEMLIVGEVGNFSQSDNLNYDVKLDLNALETGKWIGMDSLLGKITGQIVAKGSGIDPAKLNGAGEFRINSLLINGYNYSNVDIGGTLSESNFIAKGNIKDSNLSLILELSGNISGKFPSIKGMVDIEKVDLNELGFTKDTIILTTRLRIDAPLTDLDSLQANLFADSSVLVINGKTIASDSVWLIARSSPDSASLNLHSRLADVNLSTNYSFSIIADEAENIFERINPLNDSVKYEYSNHRTAFNATVNQHDILTIFIPGFKLDESLRINGQYDGGKKDSFLLFDASVSGLNYNELKLQNLAIHANNKGEAIQLSAKADAIHSAGDTLYKPSIDANWENQLITVAAQILDKNGQSAHAIKGSFQSEKETATIKLLDDLTINHEKWKVPKDNMISMRKDGFIFQNFSLENDHQHLNVKSKDQQTISPIEIRIDSFEIGEILALVSLSDTALASGSLSAAITIQQPIEKFPAFTGTVGIRDLAIQTIPVGNLELNSRSVSEKLELSGNLKGNTDLDFSGTIDPAKGNFDLKGRIQKLNMSLIREFANEFLTRASGNISAELHLTGSTTKPELNGFVAFDTAVFAFTEIRTPYRIDGQKIEINYPEARFNNFILTDTIGNKLSVDGTVKMIDASEYGLNITAKTKDFVALNSTRHSESVLYGKAILDIDLNIKGTSNEPIIEGRGSLKDKSSVHYILSRSKSDYTNTGKGMIRFVDLDTLLSPEDELAKLESDTTKVKRSFKGLKYNLNLEVSKNAEFSILIDPVTGDELLIKGEANLNAGIEENGAMGIRGTYQLHSGYYNMNTKFLRGKFLLIEGSTIIFNGDPAQADANVTTEYDIDASASGLLRPAEQEAYNSSKRLPFVIVLTIKGPISEPELAFDIKLKEGATGIPGALKGDVEEQLLLLRNDVAAMNKQVFSLLVMNQFTVYTTGDFASSDLSPDVALKQGMSQFLASGMNEIAGGLIKGVDVNVNMESYKTSDAQTKTDVGVELSKDMLNDRLTVTVGKNFTSGTTSDQYQHSANQYIPDVTTSYKLSKDGRYQVKAYRTNEYDAVVEGYFTETGVAFTIQLEYNLFKQIFQSQKKLQKE